MAAHKDNVYLDIDLLQYMPQLDIRIIDDKKHFFDPIRKKNIIVQPEELVRQLLLKHFLVNDIYPKSRIAVEKGLLIDGRKHRFDILIFDKHGHPSMLVECKSFDVPITENSAIQIAKYNQILKAPYLLLTNGEKTICTQINFEEGTTSLMWELPGI
jgi:hypothetical protein